MHIHQLCCSDADLRVAVALFDLYVCVRARAFSRCRYNALLAERGLGTPEAAQQVKAVRDAVNDWRSDDSLETVASITVQVSQRTKNGASAYSQRKRTASQVVCCTLLDSREQCI
jgi:hypothetical protein